MTLPPDDAQLVALLCAKGQGNEEHVRWQMTMTRALAAYHAIMAMEGVALDYASARHSRSARDQTRQHRRVRAFLALTRNRA